MRFGCPARGVSQALGSEVHTGADGHVAGGHTQCRVVSPFSGAVGATWLEITSLPVETSDEYSKRKIDFRGLGQHLRGRTLTSVCEALGCISIKYKNKRKMGPRTVALCKLMEQACPR